jgi:uncharacterized membrane protein
MLKPEEQQFIEYWEKNRERKKKVFRQLAIGLPMGVALAVLIFINFMSGWFTRAEMKLRTEPSLILVVMGAVLLVVVFIVVFSAWHQWDMQEQRYRELLAKKEKSEQA